ncbi:hypothetical protein Q5V23_000388 [Vibrio fluvialis]|nr:hypothetical protein [Vibrio fluvialis]
MQASPQLNARLFDLGLMVLAGVIVWQITNSMASKLNDVTKRATEDAGQVLSDFMARFNGWEPVMLQPLMIRDFYLTPEKKLTPDAEATLWKIDEYRPYLIELFGTKGGALKPQYYGLINVEITQRTL